MSVRTGTDGTGGGRAYDADVSVDGLYSSVGCWYEELGLDDFLDGEDDAISHSEADRGAGRRHDMLDPRTISLSIVMSCAHVPRVLDCLVRILDLWKASELCANERERRARIHTWKIRPSGEYVLAERSYPVPIEVIMLFLKETVEM